MAIEREDWINIVYHSNLISLNSFVKLVAMCCEVTTVTAALAWADV